MNCLGRISSTRTLFCLNCHCRSFPSEKLHPSRPKWFSVSGAQQISQGQLSFQSKLTKVGDSVKKIFFCSHRGRDLLYTRLMPKTKEIFHSKHFFGLRFLIGPLTKSRNMSWRSSLAVLGSATVAFSGLALCYSVTDGKQQKDSVPSAKFCFRGLV